MDIIASLVLLFAGMIAFYIVFASGLDHITMMYTGRSSSGSSHSWPLVQPYDLVWVEFTPTGIDHPVETVDVVDDGSVGNLNKGGTVRITYPTNDPRAARFVGATYRHLWINNLAYLGSTLLGLAIF